MISHSRLQYIHKSRHLHTFDSPHFWFLSIFNCKIVFIHHFITTHKSAQHPCCTLDEALSHIQHRSNISNSSSKQKWTLSLQMFADFQQHVWADACTMHAHQYEIQQGSARRTVLSVSHGDSTVKLGERCGREMCSLHLRFVCWQTSSPSDQQLAHPTSTAHPYVKMAPYVRLTFTLTLSR